MYLWALYPTALSAAALSTNLAAGEYNHVPAVVSFAVVVDEEAEVGAVTCRVGVSCKIGVWVRAVRARARVARVVICLTTCGLSFRSDRPEWNRPV